MEKVGFKWELEAVSARRRWNGQGGAVGTLRGIWGGFGIEGTHRGIWGGFGIVDPSGKPPRNPEGRNPPGLAGGFPAVGRAGCCWDVAEVQI